MKINRKFIVGILLTVLLVLVGVGTVMAATREVPGRKNGHHLTGWLDRYHTAWSTNALEGPEGHSIWELVAVDLGLATADLEDIRNGRPQYLEELGIDRATLQTAIESAKTQFLAEAVAAGTLTQAQADEMSAHWSQGRLRPHGGGFQLPAFIDEALLMQVLAEELGVGVEELEAARAGSKASLETLGLDRTSLGAALRDGVKQQINEAVAAGTITPSEADDLLTNLNRSSRRGPFHFGFRNSRS